MDILKPFLNLCIGLSVSKKLLARISPRYASNENKENWIKFSRAEFEISLFSRKFRKFSKFQKKFKKKLGDFLNFLRFSKMLGNFRKIRKTFLIKENVKTIFFPKSCLVRKIPG